MIAQHDFDALGACDDCGSMRWLEGPEGGASQMFKCAGCGAEYVLSPGRRERKQPQTPVPSGEALAAAETWLLRMGDYANQKDVESLARLLHAAREQGRREGIGAGEALRKALAPRRSGLFLLFPDAGQVVDALAAYDAATRAESSDG